MTYPALYLRPFTIKAAMPFVKDIHRRLPDFQGAMFATCVRLKPTGQVIGCAVVGHAARVWSAEEAVLSVLRVAVLPGHPNACSMLYGACSRAAKALGAVGLVTYTHTDEPGITLRAAGWVYGGLTSGGEHGRIARPRKNAVSAAPKHRWWAPWSTIPEPRQ